MTARDTEKVRGWVFGVVAVVVIASGVGAVGVYHRQHQHLTASAIRRRTRLAAPVRLRQSGPSQGRQGDT